MNTDKIKVVFVDTRQKIRNEAMPLVAWIIFNVGVYCLLLWLGVHWSVGLLPLLVIAYAKYQQRRGKWL